MTIGSPLLAVANAAAAVAALHFHGGVQYDQEVEYHDPDRQGELIVVVPVINAVIIVLTIVMGIGGGGGGTMRLLVLKEESKKGRKCARNWRWLRTSSWRPTPLRWADDRNAAIEPPDRDATAPSSSEMSATLETGGGSGAGGGRLGGGGQRMLLDHHCF